MSLLLSSYVYKINDISTMANDIIQSNDGNFVMVGRVYCEDGLSKGYALKISPMGTVIWEKEYSSPFSLFLESVAQLPNGTYIATGSYFYSEYAGDEHLYLVNIDDNGSIIWQKAYGEVGVQSDGNSIKATKDGGFVVAGLCSDEISKTWVLKFDSKGKIQWNNKFDIGVSFCLTETMDDGFALIGRSNIGEEDSFENYPFILRINSKGNLVWQKIYDDYSIYALLDGDIVETSDGHFAVVAKTVLMEVDSCGNLIFGVENENFRLGSILTTSNENFVVSGNYDVNYYEHSYIATFDREALINNEETEKIIWDNIDIEYNSSYRSIVLDDSGYIAGCGYLSNNENILDSFYCLFDPKSNVI